MFEMNAQALWLIGIVASVIVYAVNFYQRKQGVEVSRKVLTTVLYAVSLGLVLAFGKFDLPAFPVLPFLGGDPVEILSALIVSLGLIIGYAGQWFTVLTAVTGFAVAPYNLLYKQVLERVAPLPEASEYFAKG